MNTNTVNKLLLALAIILAIGLLSMLFIRQNRQNQQAAGISPSHPTTFVKTPGQGVDVITQIPITTNTNISLKSNSQSKVQFAITPGTKVAWINDDEAESQVLLRLLKNAIGSPVLQPGEEFSYTFTEKGIFGYNDRFHPERSGLIVVK